jgi:hypothetical protein
LLEPVALGAPSLDALFLTVGVDLRALSRVVLDLPTLLVRPDEPETAETVPLMRVEPLLSG